MTSATKKPYDPPKVMITLDLPPGFLKLVSIQEVFEAFNRIWTARKKIDELRCIK